MKSMYRRMQILTLIPRDGTITTQQLEERLAARGLQGISRRMIQRDLETIMTSGYFPITYEQDGQTYFWTWTSGARIVDTRAMEPHTALTFSLMDERMPPLLPSSSHRYLDPFFKSAKAILDDQQELPISRWRDKVRTISRSLQMTPPAIIEEVMTTVYEAVLLEKRLSIRYRPREQRESKEYPWINPLGLVFVENLIYLVATIKDYTTPLQFLLHRMEEAAILDEHAAVPDGFSLQAYIESGEFSYPVSNQTLRIKACFRQEAAAYLRDTPLPGTTTLNDCDDGRVLLEAEVHDSYQLRWWLKGFGEDVEVLEPAGLREEFRQSARRLKKMYG